MMINFMAFMQYNSPTLSQLVFLKKFKLIVQKVHLSLNSEKKFHADNIFIKGSTLYWLLVLGDIGISPTPFLSSF